MSHADCPPAPAPALGLELRGDGARGEDRARGEDERDGRGFGRGLFDSLREVVAGVGLLFGRAPRDVLLIELTS